MADLPRSWPSPPAALAGAPIAVAERLQMLAYSVTLMLAALTAAGSKEESDFCIEAIHIAAKAQGAVKFPCSDTPARSDNSAMPTTTPATTKRRVPGKRRGPGELARRAKRSAKRAAATRAAQADIDPTPTHDRTATASAVAAEAAATKAAATTAAVKAAIAETATRAAAVEAAAAKASAAKTASAALDASEKNAAERAEKIVAAERAAAEKEATARTAAAKTTTAAQEAVPTNPCPSPPPSHSEINALIALSDTRPRNGAEYSALYQKYKNQAVQPSTPVTGTGTKRKTAPSPPADEQVDPLFKIEVCLKQTGEDYVVIGKTSVQAPETLYLLMQVADWGPQLYVLAQDHEFVVIDPQRPLEELADIYLQEPSEYFSADIDVADILQACVEHRSGSEKAGAKLFNKLIGDDGAKLNSRCQK